ncbi:MAG: pilus assembly protein N-terminal domain-containing protein [Deltaproteobacteria bacterium]|nr:pilus assembly protein N-terminal domain-containing protein [Deltaproteobacteria bacterium]
MRSESLFRVLLSVLVLGGGLASEAAPAVAEESSAPEAAPSAKADTTAIEVGTGESFIYQGTRKINRVLVSDDSVAQVNLLEEGQFQVRGVEPGMTDIWVWFRDEAEVPVRHTVRVVRDLRELRSRVQELVGADVEPPRIDDIEDRLVVDGVVSDLPTLERVVAIVQVYDPEFVNLMTVSGDHQVQLEVVFAEVSRSRLRDLGVDAFWDSGSLFNGVGVTIGSAAPAGLAQTFNLVGTLAAGFDLLASLQVLEQHNLSKVLARPTLVALSGQTAEFLAGGEVPIPVAQFGNRTTIEFKEYGVKVTFLPTVLADTVVDIQVSVEVSDLDRSTALRTADITVPGLTTRKSKSRLRLASGMTFAMSGMLDERISSTRSKVPGIGDIPLLGALFRRVEHDREETELVIFVTPRLVRPLAPDEVPPVPYHTIDNDPGDFEFFMLGLDHQPPKSGSDEEPSGPVGVER